MVAAGIQSLVAGVVVVETLLVLDMACPALPTAMSTTTALLLAQAEVVAVALVQTISVAPLVYTAEMAVEEMTTTPEQHQVLTARPMVTGHTVAGAEMVEPGTPLLVRSEELLMATITAHQEDQVALAELP